MQNLVSNVDIGERMRYLRESKKLSVGDIAEAAGKGVGLVYRWERGEREPGLVEFQKIAQRLGVRLSYLLGETNEESPPTPREALNVLTDLVDQHEKQQAKFVLLRGHARELAGDDPTKWPPGLFELLADEAGEEMTKEMREIAASLEMGSFPDESEVEKKRSKGA